jgi:GNAT superfamily N-acetyltransferase
LIGLFTAVRANPNGLMLGIEDDKGRVVAAALVDLPGERPPLPSLDAIRASVWMDLGPEAKARYEAYGRMSRENDHGPGHHHLGMIGVLGSHQGTGLGRALLQHVHGLAEADAESAGVSLTTELPRNVGLYEHFGYELAGYTRVAPDLETWSFFRPASKPNGG